MFDSELQQYVAYSGFLYRAVSGDLENLITTIKECSAGYPTGHEGGTEVDPSTGEAVTYDSRTQSAALHPDPARDARKELERNIKALRSALVNLDGLRQAWLVPTEAKSLELGGDPGCVSCARLPSIAGAKRGKFEPCRQLPPTRDGQRRWSERCQFCDDWNRGEGCDPPLSVLEVRMSKGRVTSADLDKLGIKTKGTARERRSA